MGLSTCIAYVSVLQVKRRATRARYAILATLRLLACGGASPQPAPAVQVVGGEEGSRKPVYKKGGSGQPQGYGQRQEAISRQPMRASA